MNEVRPLDGTMRCPNCGGLNPATADWCGQCMKRFTAPPPPPPAFSAVPTALEDTVEATGDHEAETSFSETAYSDAAPGPAEAETVPDRLAPGVSPAEDQRSQVPLEAPDAQPIEHGAFTVTGERVEWTCVRCGSSNGIDDFDCSVCGGSFGETIGYEPDNRPVRNPNTAAGLSLLFPGAGQAYAGDVGAAIGRAIMSLWVLSITILMVMQKDLPGSALVSVVFGLATVALWAVSAHDAYQLALRQDHAVILRGRRYMYVTGGLIGILLIGLLAATAATR